MRRTPTKLVVCGAFLLVSAACGGSSTSKENDSDDGNGGSGASATGGTSATGGMPQAGGATATGGMPATGGMSGAAGCFDCPATTCFYAGITRRNGENFPSSDGCNTCTCHDGSVSCTMVQCPSEAECDELRGLYDTALEQAKRCDSDSTCSVLAASGLGCGCPTFVVEKTLLDAIASTWTTLGCRSEIVCGMCAAEPTSATCSEESVCEDVR